MSWWVYLENEDGETVSVERFEAGGTYVIGGSTYADLNITYNYSPYYYEFLDKLQGLIYLNGKKAHTVIRTLESAIRHLGTEQDTNYWAATRGNAGYALSILLKWAKQYPDATFRVS